MGYIRLYNILKRPLQRQIAASSIWTLVSQTSKWPCSWTQRTCHIKSILRTLFISHIPFSLVWVCLCVPIQHKISTWLATAEQSMYYSFYPFYTFSYYQSALNWNAKALHFPSHHKRKMLLKFAISFTRFFVLFFRVSQSIFQMHYLPKLERVPIAHICIIYEPFNSQMILL